MPDKFDRFKKPMRPDSADLDQPLFDYRNHSYPDNLGSSDNKKHKQGKEHSQSPKSKTAHHTNNNHTSAKPKGVTTNKKHGSAKAKPKGATASKTEGVRAPYTGSLPKANPALKKPKAEPFNANSKKLDNLPKRGEQANPHKSGPAKQSFAPRQQNAKNPFDDAMPDPKRHDAKSGKSLNKEESEFGEKDSKSNSSKFDPHNDDDKSKSDSDKKDDDDVNKDKDPDTNADDKKDKDKDQDKDKDSAKDKGKDDSDSDKNDVNKDKDPDTDKGKDDDQDDSSGDDQDQNLFKRALDFITGKKKLKKRSFKQMLKGAKKRDRKSAPPKDKPMHNLKDIWDRIKTWSKRLVFLLKVYIAAIKIWLLYKFITLIHAIINFIIGVFRSIISFIVGVWNAIVGFFGTVGAIVSGICSLVTVLAFGSALFSGLLTALQQQSESQALESYNRDCHTAYVQSAGTGAHDAKIKGKAGDWTKKGTAENSRAKAIFKSWVDRGLDGGAAAGIVGWVTGEGGYFTIIDRAEGHFGNTEKEAGISAGVEPTPPPGAWYKVGGGGIYQFTPYKKFAGLGSKKWLSAKAQNTQVVKELPQAGGWNSSPSIVGVSFMEFAAMSDPTKATLKWDGYEKGNLTDIQNTASEREANARKAYKMFGGSKYKFNKKKVKSWFGGGNSNGAGAVTDAGSTAAADKKKSPECQIKPHDDSDENPSSDSLVKTATKEAKGDGHPGGSKYDYWFGAAPGTEWCAIFVSWVLHHTKGYDYIPKQSMVSAFASYFKQKNEDHSYKATPKPGWIIFFDWSNEHNTGSNNSHIGIVTSVKGDKVNTVEGNDGDSDGSSRVKLINNEYSIGDKRISMYATPHKK